MLVYPPFEEKLDEEYPGLTDNEADGSQQQDEDDYEVLSRASLKVLALHCVLENLRLG